MKHPSTSRNARVAVRLTREEQHQVEEAAKTAQAVFGEGGSAEGLPQIAVAHGQDDDVSINRTGQSFARRTQCRPHAAPAERPGKSASHLSRTIN